MANKFQATLLADHSMVGGKGSSTATMTWKLKSVHPYVQQIDMYNGIPKLLLDTLFL